MDYLHKESNMSDVPIETKIAIINQELQVWKNTRYQYEVRLRVSKRNNVPVEDQAEIMKQLEQCEKWIDGYTEEKENLLKEDKESMLLVNGREV